MDMEEIGKNIIDAAIHVHRALGPGLLESVYRQCHAFELQKRGFQVATEVPLEIIYDGLKIGGGYRIDTVVEGCVIVEHKTVDQLQPIHEAQLLTYLKLGNYSLGYLLNWKVVLMKNGIKRMVYHYQEPPR